MYFCKQNTENTGIQFHSNGKINEIQHEADEVEKIVEITDKK
tara:strand:+ start:3553 stop:3678 length:126 start_codon:yes stop_codon:yes gene_type:complete